MIEATEVAEENNHCYWRRREISYRKEKLPWLAVVAGKVVAMADWGSRRTEMAEAEILLILIELWMRLSARSKVVDA